MPYRRLLPTACVLALLAACNPGSPLEPEEGEAYAGGQNFTVFDFSENAFGAHGRGLLPADEDLFVAGNALFRTNWVSAPSSVQSLDGLGPLFNAISCGSCHFKDGRAAPPATPDAALNGLLFRLSVPGSQVSGAPAGDPVYGGQLQDKSILGVAPEARVSISYEELPDRYPDGSAYSLRKPVHTFSAPGYGSFDPALMVSPRIAPQLPGMGLLAHVPEALILEWEDPDDADGDGISGRANYVWEVRSGRAVLGRFGWKANQPSLMQQAAAAFNGDMGLTSSLFPQDHLTASQQAAYPGIPNGGSPEVSDAQLERVVRYLEVLAVPARRDWEAEPVLEGKALFAAAGCASCHRPALQTGSGHAVSALNQQELRPYTDLLLHDMGPGLADGRPDFLASGQEWRTPPLWGIGLIPVVNGHMFLLHDGRARSLEEAILWHGGEAEASAERFKELSAAERAAVIAFLESL